MSSKKNMVVFFATKKLMKEFEEHIDLKEHALDFIDTYTSKDIAEMVREGILTLEEVEQALRRKICV